MAGVKIVGIEPASGYLPDSHSGRISLVIGQPRQLGQGYIAVNWRTKQQVRIRCGRLTQGILRWVGRVRSLAGCHGGRFRFLLTTV
jgi:hypothetical protein